MPTNTTIRHTTSVPLSHITLTKGESYYTAPCGCSFSSRLLTPEDDGTAWTGYEVVVSPCFDPENRVADNVAVYTSEAPNLMEARKGIRQWLKSWSDEEIREVQALKDRYVQEMRSLGYKIADDGGAL